MYHRLEYGVSQLTLANLPEEKKDLKNIVQDRIIKPTVLSRQTSEDRTS